MRSPRVTSFAPRRGLAGLAVAAVVGLAPAAVAASPAGLATRADGAAGGALPRAAVPPGAELLGGTARKAVEDAGGTGAREGRSLGSVAREVSDVASVDALVVA